MLLALSITAIAAAQSSDVSQPTPLRANEIEGRIAPRDIGDPRTTQHYYLFSALPGDLTLTITSDNLNGNVDLFTAAGLRPLAQIVIYGSDTPSRISRTIFFRQTENLIMRVDARTPNDREGGYQIRFDGGFTPADVPYTDESAISQNSSETIAAGTNRRGVRRTTSVGGRIEEPERERANVPPADAPAPASSEPNVAAPETPAPAGETATPSTVARRPVRTPSRRTRSERPPSPVRRSTRTRSRAPVRRRPPTTTSEETTTAAPSPEDTSIARPETNARLVIETTDGERNARAMSGVQRVTIENGEIVIVMIEGQIERVPLTRVRRVAIEP